VTILIVTNNRCGSRAFSNWLKKVMEFQSTLITSEKNTDVLYNVILNPMEVDDFYNKENTIVVLTFDDYKKFIKKFKFIPEEKFDIVICLKRANTREQSESYVRLLEYGYSNRPYFISEEWILKNETTISKFDKKFKKDYNDMKSVFGLHIEYDSLYDEGYPKDLWNVVSYIGIIAEFHWILNRSFKLRKDNKLNLI
jgi:hypothetical protein